MPPAARVTDMHVCPMVTGLVPHVGGPVLPPGCPTVLIGMMPAARVGDMLTCVGPPDVIAMGSPTVLIGNMMAARMGDMTAHGGVIVVGCRTRDLGSRFGTFRSGEQVTEADLRDGDIILAGRTRFAVALFEASGSAPPATALSEISAPVVLLPTATPAPRQPPRPELRDW